MKIAIVVPAYNEEERIVQTLKDLKTTKLPIFVVDDGSKDLTYQLSVKCGVRVLRHKVNLGKGMAMKTGARAVFANGYDAVIFMDGDGQHLVSDLHKFITALKKEHYDAVFGIRDMNMVPGIRGLGNKLVALITNLLFRVNVLDALCGYKAITKRCFGCIEWKSTTYEVELEILIKVVKAGLRYKKVPVQVVYYDKLKGMSVLNTVAVFRGLFLWKLGL